LDRDLGILVVCVNAPTEGMTKIKGIRDHAHPETFLPVEITTDADFRASLKKPRQSRLADGRIGGVDPASAG
jgi:hypothetical protein